MAEITIAVPVYNGQEFIRRCLECLQSQTFRDFEVLVLDNASTDRTRDIIEEFVAADSRFRLVVQPHNKGALANFIDGFDAATTRYFLWRAFDDLSDENYLEELRTTLKQHPEAKLATGVVRSLRLDGSKERHYPPPRLTGIEVLDILTLMFKSHAGWFYGLWDREALAPIWRDVLRAFPHAWASDHLALFPLLVGRACAFTDRTTFSMYIKKIKTTPRSSARPPVSEMLAYRRDSASFCNRIVDARFPNKPLTRAVLKTAVWFYVGKRVYRFRTVAGRALGRPLRRLVKGSPTS
jgi:glycosyltransferase involved in cell wall biosynthesis